MRSGLKAQLAVGVIGISAMFGLVSYANNLRDDAQQSPECKNAAKAFDAAYPKLAEAVQGAGGQLDNVTIVMKPKASGYACVLYRRAG